MAKECKSGKMAQSTRENGPSIQQMVKVGLFKVRVTYISVSGKIIKHREKANLWGRTAVSMMETGSTMNSMGSAQRRGSMEVCMKVSTSWVRSTAKGSLHGPMDLVTKASLTIMKSADMATTSGLIRMSTGVPGRQIKCMAMESTHITMAEDM